MFTFHISADVTSLGCRLDAIEATLKELKELVMTASERAIEIANKIIAAIEAEAARSAAQDATLAEIKADIADLKSLVNADLSPEAQAKFAEIETALSAYAAAEQKQTDDLTALAGEHTPAGGGEGGGGGNARPGRGR